MANEEIKKHIHTYRRIPKSRTLYMCADPHCTHRMSKTFLLGKASLCNKCGDEFELTKYDLKLALPVCARNCSTQKDHAEARRKRLILEEIGICR